MTNRRRFTGRTVVAMAQRGLRALARASRATAATLDPQRLRFDRRLVLTFSVLVAVVLAACLQSLWFARQVGYYSERSRLADQVLIAYHRLKSDVIELHGSLAESDEGDGSRLLLEAALIGKIEQVISQIRQLIASEVVLVGHEEVEELATLGQIEKLLGSIAYDYRKVGDDDVTELRKQAHGRLSVALNSTKERNLREIIAAEIEDESREAAQAEQRLNDLAVRSSTISKVLALAGLLFGTLATGLLVRGVRRPLAVLVGGTQAIARGDLDHRMAIAGNDEFAHVARSFNAMAEDLSRRIEQVRTASTDMERIIEQRTQELKAANETLEQADATRRRFLADVSHELRTPLTIMRGEAEVALRGGDKPTDEYRNALKRIVEQAAHTATLVDDLLFLARRESGDTRLKQQPVALVELVSRVCDESAVLGSERDVSVQFRSSVKDVLVVGDPGRLRQMVLILIDNAVRYSAQRSAISVDMLLAFDAVVMRVSDCGIGIAEDEIPRVFERYYRGENAASAHVEGTGLGLPMAKTIVEAHGGSIELESEFGRGTVVTVKLPVARRVRAA